MSKKTKKTNPFADLPEYSAVVADIETAPAVVDMYGSTWKPTIVGIRSESFILSCSFLDLKTGKRKHLQLPDYSRHTTFTEKSDKRLVRAIVKELNKYKMIIGHNIVGYDIPTINARSFVHQVKPVSVQHTLDTLTAARGLRFASKKMDHLCKQLEIGQKVEHQGVNLFKLAAASRSPKIWAMIKKYNDGDVMINRDLYELLIPYLKKHPNISIVDESMRCVACSTSFDDVTPKKNGFRETAKGKYQKYICGNCGAPNIGNTNLLTKEQRLVRLK